MSFADYGPALRVEGGLKAQSARGAIGESWWSKRFIAVLEAFALGSRLTRGRSYARRGQVLSLEVAPGWVTASVQGSRPAPYRVRIGLAIVAEPTWVEIEAALAAQAIFTARLLAGEMPAQIEEVFDAAGAPLFPTLAGQLSMSCSCPDSTVPCKHIAATFYLLAEAFDVDPFQILHWRGRDRATLLAHLRALRGETRAPAARASRGGTPSAARAPRGGTTGTRAKRAAAGSPPRPAIGAAAALGDLAAPELAGTVERFWVPPLPLPARPPTMDTEADLLLRQLATPAAAIGGVELVAHLRPLYAALRPRTPDGGPRGSG